MDIIKAIVEKKMEFWLHEEQKKNLVMGYEIVKFLFANPPIGLRCVRLSGFQAIQSEGLEFVQKYFSAEEIIFGLSICSDFSPFFAIRKDIVVQGWCWNGYRRGIKHPTLLFT